MKELVMAFRGCHVLRRIALHALATLTLCAILSIIIGAPAAAQDKNDAKAVRILEVMSDYLSRARTMSFKADVTADRTPSQGETTRSSRTSVILLKRPKHLRVLSIAAGGGARTAWFDGARLTVFFRAKRQYTTLRLQGGTDALLERLIDEYELELPLAHLLLSDFGAFIKTSIRSATYLGEARIAGVKGHHVVFDAKGAKWQIWIEADATPLPRRIDREIMTGDAKARFSATLNLWRIDPPTGARDFTPEIPYQTKQVPFAADQIAPKAPR